MSDAYHDPVLRRAIDELRRLPEVDSNAVRAVVAAAADARVSGADEPYVAQAAARRRGWSVAGIAAVAAAAAFTGFFLRGSFVQPSVHRAVTDAAGAPRDVHLAVADPSSPALIPQQFELTNGTARRVSVVGDFNGWNATTTPMAKVGARGHWSAVVPIVPGRHVYGFMIDDSLFVLDPRAERTRDPDFGTEGSVIMVGRP